MGPVEVPAAVLEIKNRLPPPFLRPSNPWRSHQIDGAARFFELHRVSFFIIKWKTLGSWFRASFSMYIHTKCPTRCNTSTRILILLQDHCTCFGYFTYPSSGAQ
jgi:hypothetical protein